MIRIIDSQSKSEIPWEEFVKEFGEPKIKTLPASVSGWRIVRLEVDHTGSNTVLAKVYGEDCSLKVGQPVAFYWPDADQDASCGPDGGVLPDMRRGRCLRGQTKETGNAEFAMGRGAYYFPPAIGPHAVWCYGQNEPSELLFGIGMLGGLNHWHYNVVFQWSKGEETLPPPDVPPTPPDVPPPPPDVPPSIMISKLGFYVQKPNVSGLFDVMREIRPPVMVVHAVNRGWLEDTRRFSPETFIVGRLFQERDQQDQWLSAPDSDNPGRKKWLGCEAARQQGRRFAEQILSLDHPLALATWPYGGSLDDPNTHLLVDAWMSLNEFVQGPASEDYRNDPADIRAKADAYDCFQAGFRQRLKEAHPRLEAVAFNFAAGNFPDAQGYLDWFPRTLESYVYLGFHEYGWPTLYPDQGSAASGGDYRRAMTGIRAKHGNRHKALITEAGLARMHQKKDGRDVGWLDENDAISEDDYWRSLRWYNEQLSHDDYVLGACLYNVGYEEDWRTFRHTGADNQGHPIRIMDRIRALRDGATARDMVSGQIRPASLRGRVASRGRPVAGAKVRLLGRAEDLGADPHAAAYDPTAITWTRTIDGFEGNAWNCWQRFVAPNVAGITWEEFQAQVTQYNLSLRETRCQFVAGQTYIVPEMKRFDALQRIDPEVAWDRPVIGFAGDRWSCWQHYVRAKVTGVTWAEFKEKVGVHNPHLIEDGYRFLAGKSYLLPRNPGQERYTRVAITGADGRYHFPDLLPGRYELEVTAAGYKPLHLTVEADGDLVRDLDLERFLIVTPRDLAFVTAQGTHFVVLGRQFQFTGVNLRGLAYYDTDKYQHARQRDQLKAAREMGARVVRLFLPHKDAPTSEVKARLTNLLNLLRSEFPDIYLIVALTDLYINSNHFPQGDERFYVKYPDNWTLLGRQWFEGGYKQNYLPFVEAIVSAFRKEPHILAWDIGNELKLPEARPVFIDFNLAMAQRIRELDGNHLIATGMMSTRHAGLQFPGQRRLYGSPHIDLVTNHIYNADYRDDDSALAAELKKPFLVEEAGFDAAREDNRTERIRQDMKTMFERGARGYMQWGFMAGSDNNDGDKDRGMDHALHSDWDGLFNVYKDRAFRLQQEVR